MNEESTFLKQIYIKTIKCLFEFCFIFHQHGPVENG